MNETFIHHRKTTDRYTIVAIEAVAAKDVPDYTLVAGVPAGIIGKVDEKGNRI